MADRDYTAEEMMTVAAARQLNNGTVCFVGIGAPSAACNLARLTHAPDITLIYESGTIGAKPDVLPLSIGDGELCATALTTVSVPEMFRYWLQGGRVDIGFLGAAQVDRFGNINTTVIGDYQRPKVRLPGAGGAPPSAGSSRPSPPVSDNGVSIDPASPPPGARPPAPPSSARTAGSSSRSRPSARTTC